MLIKILFLLWAIVLLMGNVKLCIKVKNQQAEGDRENLKAKVFFVSVMFVALIIWVVNIWRKPLHLLIVYFLVLTILMYNFNKNLLSSKKREERTSANDESAHGKCND